MDGDGGVDSKKFLAGLDIEISALFYSQVNMQRYMCTVSVHDYIFIKSTS